MRAASYSSGLMLGERGHVDDGAVAGVLPDVGQGIDELEVAGHRQVVDRLHAECAHQHAEQAEPRVQEQDDHRRHHYRGDEVRRVGDHLHRPLEGALADLVERQRQDDRRREAEQQPGEADGKGVLDQPPEARRLEEADELPEPDPGAAPHALNHVEVPERDLRAHHRHVLEDDDVRHRHQHQQVVLPVLENPPADPAGAAPAQGCDRVHVSRHRSESVLTHRPPAVKHAQHRGPRGTGIPGTTVHRRRLQVAELHYQRIGTG